MKSSQEFSIYQNLCTQVYDLDKPTPPENELAFYLKYVQEAQGPILEPMCGSGRFLIPFMDAGYDIAGFDASSFMIQALQEKCLAKNLNPKVWQGFVEDLDQGPTYSLAFIPSGSFNLITDMESVKKGLQKICASLVKDGVFVFELITLHELNNTELNKWFGSMLSMPDGKKILMSKLFLPCIKQVAPLVIRYELIDNDQILKTEIEIYHHRFYQLGDLETLLKDAGFSNVKAIKAFDHDQSPGYQDGIIVLECRK